MEENQNTGNQIWLTIDEAFAACQTEGLGRTKKTVRQWCRNEHVEARKQTSPTGERWVIDKDSLLVKIRSELSFQADSGSRFFYHRNAQKTERLAKISYVEIVLAVC